MEEVCAALREALDAEHKRRMEAFETKMKPIIIKDGPSRKVTTLISIKISSAHFLLPPQANFKISAAKLYYEIYSLSQRLRLTTIRVEHEESVSENLL